MRGNNYQHKVRQHSMSLPSFSPNISTASPLLSNVTTTAANLGNLALVIPSKTQGYQPQNPPNSDGTPSQAKQPPAFMFDYEGEQSLELNSDITDHYIEDNTAIQDQIALKPVRVTTKGFISELNDVVPGILQPLKTVSQKLTSINSYAPSVSLTATLAYNQAFQAYQIATNAINSAIAAWASLSGSGTSVISGNFPIAVQPAQNKQQTAFQTFYGYWYNRTFFTIQTPWAIFQNMVIEKLRPVQGEDTNTISTFECIFKQIRTAQSATSLPQSSVSQGRLSNQSSSVTSQGISTPPNRLSLSDGLKGPTSASFPGVF